MSGISPAMTRSSVPIAKTVSSRHTSQPGPRTRPVAVVEEFMAAR
jgi:hypothetical protein